MVTLTSLRLWEIGAPVALDWRMGMVLAAVVAGLVFVKELSRRDKR